MDLADASEARCGGNTVFDQAYRYSPVLKGERASGLTNRELEILQLIVSGKSNKEVRSDLSLSVNTVAVHRANIMETLGIHNTAELVVYAIKNGLVNLS